MLFCEHYFTLEPQIEVNICNCVLVHRRQTLCICISPDEYRTVRTRCSSHVASNGDLSVGYEGNHSEVIGD